MSIKESKGEDMEIRNQNSSVYIACCVWSLQFVLCDFTSYFVISYLLQKMLGEGQKVRDDLIWRQDSREQRGVGDIILL